MSKKLLMAIGLLLILLGVVFILLMIYRHPTDFVPVSNGNFGSSSSTTDVSNTEPNKIAITASDESTVQTKDITKDPVTVKDKITADYYYVGYHTSSIASDTTATENPPYLIEYINSTHYFNIELLKEPIKEMRQQAEQYLMAHLGLNQDQMCQIKYSVSVPYSVNQIYSGMNLGFSFCSGATQL